MAARDTIRVYSGDTWEDLGWQWLDSESVVIPIASARMQFRERVSSTSALLSLDETDGIEISLANEVFPALTAEQTDDLISGVWDLEVTAASGQIKTLGYGPLIVQKDVTRETEIAP